MEITYGSGNGKISVNGYKHKIVISVSADYGQNWHSFKTVKAYGSRARVEEMWGKVERIANYSNYDEFKAMLEKLGKIEF